MKKVTTTQLTHKTRSVIQDVMTNKEPVVIVSYNTPVVMIVPATEEWKKKINKEYEHPSIDELEKFMLKTPRTFNSTDFFRNMRDEE